MSSETDISSIILGKKNEEQGDPGNPGNGMSVTRLQCVFRRVANKMTKKARFLFSL